MYRDTKRRFDHLSLSDDETSSGDSASGVFLTDSDDTRSVDSDISGRRSIRSSHRQLNQRNRPWSNTCATSPPSPSYRASSHHRGTMTTPLSRPSSRTLSQHSSPAELLYAEIRKPPKPKGKPRAKKRVCFREAVSLSSIKEISPVSLAKYDGENNENIGQRLDNLIGQRSSSVANPSPFKSPGKPIPKTNPYFTLPRTASSALSTGKPKLGLCQSTNEQTVERVSSYYESDDGSLSSHGEFSSQSSNLSYGMHRYLTGLKSFGIKGELYLSANLNRGLLTIQIDEGRHYQASNPNPCNSYARLSLMPDQEKRTQCRTGLVPRTNSPIYNQTFTMELLPEDYEKKLLISVWNRNLATQKSSLLGCMAFTVKHLIHSHKQIDGWYFLLAPSFGRRKHLAVDKVKMLTYYGSVDSGLQTTTPTLSSETTSGQDKHPWPIPVLRTPDDSTDTDFSNRREMASSTDTSTSCSRGWAPSSTSVTSSSTGSFARGSTGTFFSNLIEKSPLRKLSTKDNRRRACSSTHLDALIEPQPIINSHNGKSVDMKKCNSCKTPRRKVTFYSNQSEDVSTSSAETGPHLGESDPDRLNVTERLLIDRGAAPNSVSGTGSLENLRRAQSFTANTRNREDQLEGQRKISAIEMGTDGVTRDGVLANQVTQRTETKKKKSSFAAPIAKKFSFLKKRSGTDGSLIIAQNQKITREEIQNWSNAFEQLLRHKHGVSLFRLFLQREFSDENIDFWIACEEYKEVKDSKLLTRAREIFAEFVAVQAPKEVNLDSDTRTATEQAIERCNRDGFENAQHRIEHLMEKDSYPRFLKSDLYMDLLNSTKK